MLIVRSNLLLLLQKLMPDFDMEISAQSNRWKKASLSKRSVSLLKQPILFAKKKKHCLVKIHKQPIVNEIDLEPSYSKSFVQKQFQGYGLKGSMYPNLNKKTSIKTHWRILNKSNLALYKITTIQQSPCPARSFSLTVSSFYLNFLITTTNALWFLLSLLQNQTQDRSPGHPKAFQWISSPR